MHGISDISVINILRFCRDVRHLQIMVDSLGSLCPGSVGGLKKCNILRQINATYND